MPKQYSNQLFLADLSNVSKSVWEIGKAYEKRALAQIEKNPRNFKRPAELVKLCYLTYMTGSRIGEMLRQPYPRLSVLPLKKWTIMHVEKINEKHFTTRVPLNENEPAQFRKRRKLNLEKSEREVIAQNFPLDGIYEKRMWDYITDEGQNLNLKTWITGFGEYTPTTRTAITNRFKDSFKARLTDGEKIYENHSVNPHILRHLRAYSLLFNKDYKVPLIQSYFGWERIQMLTDHYVYIKRAIKDREQLAMLERTLTDQSHGENNEFALGGI